MPVQSIFDGTWGGSETPPEFMTFMLCWEFKMSPARLRREFSMYEQRYFWDFLNEWNQAKKDRGGG